MRSARRNQSFFFEYVLIVLSLLGLFYFTAPSISFIFPSIEKNTQDQTHINLSSYAKWFEFLSNVVGATISPIGTLLGIYLFLKKRKQQSDSLDGSAQRSESSNLEI